MQSPGAAAPAGGSVLGPVKRRASITARDHRRFQGYAQRVKGKRLRGRCQGFAAPRPRPCRADPRLHEARGIPAQYLAAAGVKACILGFAKKVLRNPIFGPLSLDTVCGGLPECLGSDPQVTPAGRRPEGGNLCERPGNMKVPEPGCSEASPS